MRDTLRYESSDGNVEIVDLIIEHKDHLFETICNNELTNENYDLREKCNENSISVKELHRESFEHTEFVTDLEMIRGVANYLESIRYLDYKEWTKLTMSERLHLLNMLEQEIAKIELRPAVKVITEKLDDSCLGYHCGAENLISINSIYIGSNDPLCHRKIIETLIHEGRHAYQRYNVDVKCIHESLSEVKEWEKNFYDPYWRYYSYRGQKILIPFDDGKIQDVGYRLYANQPVEIDARNFSSEILIRLEGKGLVLSQS